MQKSIQELQFDRFCENYKRHDENMEKWFYKLTDLEKTKAVNNVLGVNWVWERSGRPIEKYPTGSVYIRSKLWEDSLEIIQNFGL